MTAPATFACTGCGARVEYAPGTQVLRCPYCQREQQVTAVPRQVHEHAWAELPALRPKPHDPVGAHTLVCQRCGASSQTDALASTCQFCGAPLMVAQDAIDQITPEAVLPFGVDRSHARDALRGWVSTRRFAPSSLKRVTEAETLAGTYLPHWTYDAATQSEYTGERGEHYWVTEAYTTTGADGKPQTQTRQVQRTRWYPAYGTVSHAFDDVLVAATVHVDERTMERLSPWPLLEAVPYQRDYLAGYQALRYDVEPEAGLDTAKAEMAPVIQEDCRHDIGGDEQRVHTIDTQYRDVMFKLMLLPVWIACYLYRGKTFQVHINARTGEVIGERPYSVAKIAAAVTAAVALIAAIIVLIVYARHR